MLNLLFSPNGRINSADFMRGAYVLIGLSFVIALLPLISFSIGTAFGLLSIVMLWCWIVLWIKRYHDAGKSGWMCLVPIIAFIILALVANMVMTATGMSGMDPEIQAQMDDAATSGDFGSMFGAMMGASEEIAKKTAIPSAVSGAIVSLIVAFLFNSMIKGEPNENRFGPAT